MTTKEFEAEIEKEIAMLGQILIKIRYHADADDPKRVTFTVYQSGSIETNFHYD
jgi:hypothetical protein